jgi:adenine C2-methylase RlmN of 23S rRNA A2503 and tRNA A37
VEVKIGVADSPRELTVSTADTPDEIEALVTEALRNAQGLLTLVDDRGRRYMVPTSRVAYIEIGPADSRRVGFSVGGS